MKVKVNLDKTAKTLVFANGLTIVLAVLLGFDLAVLMWVYWLESVIIGIFAFLKLLIAGARRSVLWLAVPFALFFAVHYGMFHFGYMIFLLVLPWFSIDPAVIPWILASGVILLVSHIYSFKENVLKKKMGIVELGASLLFFEPYTRIFPMHITIIASGFAVFYGEGQNLIVLLIFMGLKTVSDLVFHLMKYSQFRLSAILVR